MSDENGTIDLDGNTTPTNLLPTRKFLMEIIGCEKTLSSNGKPRLTIRFQVAAGSCKGRRFIEDCYLTPAAMWKVKALADAAGVKGKVNPNDPADLADKFEGKKLYVTLGEDNYTDRNGNECEGRKSTAYDSTEAKVAEARSSKGNNAGSQTPPPQESGEGADQEIPF